MSCFWLNDALCLRPENKEERSALGMVYDSFRAGLKPLPDEDISAPEYYGTFCSDEDGNLIW
jgi:hypothetical protein